jgi:hypothetical protein
MAIAHAPLVADRKGGKTPAKAVRRQAPRPTPVPRGPHHSLEQVTVLPVARIKLPFQAELEERFDRPLDGVTVVTGEPVAEWLAESHAEAGATGNVIWLASPAVRIEAVAHEVVHTLQAQAPASQTRGPLSPEAGTLAEAEASTLASTESGAPVQQSLQPGVVAFKRTVPSSSPPGKPTGADAFARERDRTPQPPKRDREVAKSQPETEPPASEAETTAAEEGQTGKPPAEAPQPTFELPPMPETELTPEEKAARQAELQAAQEAIAQATDAKGVVAAYADAPPTVKAATQSTIGGRITEVIETDQREFDANLPDFHATMTGGELPDETAPVAAPDPAAYAFEPDQPSPAPPATVPHVPPPTRYAENDDIIDLLLRFFGFGAAEAIAKALGRTMTSDPGVDTYPGDKPRVQLKDDTDPAELARQKREGEDQARAARDAATQAVIDGRGAEQAQLRAMDEVRGVGELTPVQPDSLAGAPEAERFNQMALPEEVLAQFDADMGETMQASLEEARTQFADAEKERDTKRDAAVATAERNRDRLTQDADAQQRTHVTAARETIQTERQATIDAQHDAVTQLELDAEQKRADAESGIDATVTANETIISTSYDQAEVDAKAKVAKGEEDAEAERLKADREAEEESWWDKAVGFVSDLFDKLTSLINDIFDAVRSAVTAVFDAVRDLAKGLIDAVAGLVKAAISAFGAVLKTMVDATIGQVFPELAADLNAGIDSAVETANSAVDSVADTLKAGVDAVVDVLEKAVNFVIDTFQAAVNTAIGFMEAAITGDWGKFALRVLESVLRILGIDREEFYGFIASIKDTVEIIIDDPLGFVSHLIDAVVLGIQKFADRFGEHLRAGVIAWLTGALGDIQIPKEFNLAGVLDLARQVLGLTWDWLRKKAVDLIGERNVARVEFILSYVQTLVDEGFGGLWQRITNDLGNLVDSVLGQMKEYLLTEVVLASIKWIASLFSPVGALVKLVMTAWNLYTFVRDQLRRIYEIAKTIVSALADLARGVIEGAALRIETALANLLPVAIDLVAKLLGVTGIASAVRGIIQDIRAAINRAVDALLKRVLQAFGKGEAPAVAGTPEQAPDGQAVGTPLTVDVADGPDHTLSIAVSGAEATVMLATDPLPVATWLGRLDDQANGLKDEERKRTALDQIDAARKLLKELDPEVDKAAAAHAGGTPSTKTDEEVKKDQVRLRDALQAAFNAVGGRSAAILGIFATEIKASHEAAQDQIKSTLGDNELAFQTKPWNGIRAELVAKHEPYKNPMVASYKFGRAAQAAVRNLLPPGVTFDTDKDALDHFVTFWVVRLVDNAKEPVFAGARQDLQRLIFEGGAIEQSAPLKAAVAEAYQQQATLGEQPDQDLKDAATGRIIDFLVAVATGDATFGTLLLQEEWENRYWKRPNNREWIKEQFRKPGGLHEWILTHLIDQVIERDRQATGSDGYPTAATWIKLQNALRSPTRLVIFPLTYAREAPYLRNPQTKERIDGGGKVLQGHPGAIYAPLDDDGYRDKAVQQTKGSPGWHSRLENIFTSNTGADFATMKTIVGEIDTFWQENLWSGGDTLTYDEYYTKEKDADGTGLEPVSAIQARAAAAAEQIQNNFKAARAAAGI